MGSRATRAQRSGSQKASKISTSKYEHKGIKSQVKSRRENKRRR